MPLEAQKVHSFSYDLAKHQAGGFAVLDYVSLFYFNVINANP